MQVIKLSEEAFDRLPDKKTTIRHGKKDYHLGEALFQSTDKNRLARINILRIEYCQFGNIYCSDIENDGFKDHNDAFESLIKYYPAMEWLDTYTVLKFSTIQILGKDELC
jgi:hypothetical protein